MPVGVVMRRSPGITRWARWVWKAGGLLPGAPQADWKLLREDGDVSDFHAATRDVWLYVSDTEAYAHELGTHDPSLYVILRASEDSQSSAPLDVIQVTASPYEAQDYADSGEEIVEKVPMPAIILKWVADFVKAHHSEEPFVKRRRDKSRTDRVQDGIGDPRIAQPSDVYRAPSRVPSEVPE
ncbi:DUF3305 domain-containing protein [uncultured Roseobacter sp.]|uniref:DUF3305 domain-containing protein n=1 Tax=uncultured Roseobacter sp. TaxID=114847 RepID=UPI002619B6B9|nr:DUF3305 domain-containing protein [uncultured Roseobacter sp.]